MEYAVILLFMFSVIIPLYNKAPYILKTVESVLQQTFNAFELIIINDGSTDNSADKLVGIQDERISLVSQLNSGVSVARNNGAKYAKYEYLAFLDADDWWSNCFLEEMYQLITSHPDAALYGSNYYVVKNNKYTPGQVGVTANFTKGYINYFEVYSKTFWVPINCSFVIVKKTTFMKEKGFKSNLKFGEDFDLWVRIAINHKVAYVNKFLSFSNQDVDLQNRALQYDKLWKTEEHVIFNIAYLQEEENELPELKLLLDGLRVRSLMDFYIKGIHEKEVNLSLDNINWETQPYLYKLVYHSPIILINLFFFIKKIAFNMKIYFSKLFV